MSRAGAVRGLVHTSRSGGPCWGAHTQPSGRKPLFPLCNLPLYRTGESHLGERKEGRSTGFPFDVISCYWEADSSVISLGPINCLAKAKRTKHVLWCCEGGWFWRRGPWGGSRDAANRPWIVLAAQEGLRLRKVWSQGLPRSTWQTFPELWCRCAGLEQPHNPCV